MSSSLSITTQLTNDNKIEVLASITSGALPTDIFIYVNNGTTTLGDYIGVCNLEEYQRLQTFSDTAIPVFGNRYVKTTQAKIILSITDDLDTVIKHITNTVTFLSFALSNSSASIQIINIP